MAAQSQFAGTRGRRGGGHRPAARLAAVMLLLAPWLCCPLHAAPSDALTVSTQESTGTPPCPHHEPAAAPADVACGDGCGPELPAGSTPDGDAKPAHTAGSPTFELRRPMRRQTPDSLGLARPPPPLTPVLRSDVLLT